MSGAAEAIMEAAGAGAIGNVVGVDYLPKRCWSMQTGWTTFRAPVFRACDEFDNPTIAVRVWPSRYFVLVTSRRLKSTPAGVARV